MKRIRALPAFFISCGAVAFLAASLSTKYWFVAEPKVLVGDEYSNNTGELHFGLFRGTKTLVNPFGIRDNRLTIVCAPKNGVCMYSDKDSTDQRTDQLNDNLYIKDNSNSTVDNPHLMSFGLWTFTVVTVAVSLFFGLISAIFAVVNTVITPVEFITGFYGLYVWSGLAGVSALLAVCSWAALYHSTLKINVMNKTDMDRHWVSKGFTHFGYSYWFVLISTFLYLLNIIVLTLIAKQPWRKKQKHPTQGKNPEGAIMLY